ncbi:MAG: DEAD/DEAH box helicase family protein [Prevotella sp.]|nr:DEAD/DEAH box helicase family protein [Candidatus Prevotella equi]
MKLYQHNQEAYKAITEGFKTKERIAIVHATGTGKSYLIGAVSYDYDNVLVIAPNNFVLNETRKVCKEGTKFRTYASVMYDEEHTTRYDLIVLDEFHRSGAEKWGEGVQRLLQSNPQAKVLGTSATHIRYLDNERNMADELFDGNIVSCLPLKDAIDRNILPNPTYVSALYSFDNITKTITERINKSNKNEETKRDALRRLSGIAQSWSKSKGVPGIMRKYMTHDMQRVIVFCSKVETKKEARYLLGSWFATAGFSHIRFYNIDYTEKRLEKEMEDFQAPCEDGVLKVAMSVNMLNEGVHIPRVDCVIMLRSTISRIIIEQQVGRCLTADNNGRTPLVLDLVNNMESVGNFGFVEFSDCQKGGESTGITETDKGFPFRITDEIRDIRILLTQLDNEYATKHFYTKDEMRKIVSQYTTLREFRNERENEYSYILRRGWKELLERLQRSKNSYTKEECISIARQYTSRQELRIVQKTIYSYILNNGWSEECFAHMEYCHKPITKEECIEVTQRYDNYTIFNREQPRIARALRKYGWHDELTAHMGKIRENWTIERLKKRIAKYTKLSDFSKNENSAYQYIKTHNLDYLLDSLEKRKTRTFDECMKVALDYVDKIEFYNKERKLYIYARNHKWLDKLCEHMTNKREKQWTKERVLEVASQCDTLKIFKERFGGAYNVACHNGYINEVKELCTPRFMWTYETAKAKALEYESYTEFTKQCFGCFEAIQRNGWHELLLHLKKRIKKYSVEELAELITKYDNPLDFKHAEPLAYRAAMRRNMIKCKNDDKE